MEIQSRESFEKQLKEQNERLVEMLVQSGVDEAKARQEATKQSDAMGATKIMRGECQRGAFSPAVCMFCPFGHITECHYPQTCEAAQCSHYLRETEAECYGEEP